MVLMGMLFAQYTITGFDASRTFRRRRSARARNAPVAIIRSIYLSAIAVFVMNVVMVAAMPEDKIGEIGAQGIVAGGAVFVASIAGFLGKFLVIIATVGQFFCGLASVTANSRMIYAFSREQWFARVKHLAQDQPEDPYTNQLAVAGCGSQRSGGPPDLGSERSWCAGGVLRPHRYLCRRALHQLRDPDLPSPHQSRLQAGAVEPGHASKMIGWISVAWVPLIGILFVLPIFKIDFTNWETFYSTMNWTGPILVVSALAIWIWWKVSANKWFTGPRSKARPRNSPRSSESWAPSNRRVNHHPAPRTGAW